MAVVALPTADGGTEHYRLGPASPYAETAPGPFNRVAYAAAHVVADPRASVAPWQQPALDWDATIAYRHRLWALGFKIAEAMDTSQRGMGLDWATAKELIRRSLAAAKAVPGADLACGAGTDQLAPAPGLAREAVVNAYAEQVAWIERHGGRCILMASRALAASAAGPDDYLWVYDRILAQAAGKVILHWLGPMFDPALSGYWGSRDLDAATETLLTLIQTHAARIDGVKVSLLDKDRELAFRKRLPAGVRLFTGDDFNYAELIEGDGERHSDGLLGIFDAIAPAASAALAELAAGRTTSYRDILAPTVALSRRIFEAPTQYYKAGIVVLAWLNGFQDHFAMVGGMQSARSILHYADVLRLADRAKLLRDPELAARRMGLLTALHGIG